jgi:hypothetical protein
MSGIFRGGVPTRRDVDLLMKLDAKPGTHVSYEEVEKIIGADPKSSRFRTVTISWRKRLFRELLLQSVAEGGKFVFLTADGAHDAAMKNVTRMGRAIGRHAIRVEAIDERDLSQDRVAKHAILKQQSGALRHSAQDVARAIAALKPIDGQGLRLAPQ